MSASNTPLWDQVEISIPAASRGCHYITEHITKIPCLQNFRIGLCHIFSNNCLPKSFTFTFFFISFVFELSILQLPVALYFFTFVVLSPWNILSLKKTYDLEDGNRIFNDFGPFFSLHAFFLFLLSLSLCL